MAEQATGPPEPVPDRLIYQTTAHVQPIVNQLTELIDSANFTDGAAIHDLLAIVRDQLQLSLNVENHLERYNILAEENMRLSTENDDLTATIDQNLERINELMDDRDSWRTQAQNLSTRTDSSIGKTPDPEKFSGDKSKFRTFLTQLRLRVADFTDEQRKLRYAINLLTGDAALHVQRFVQNDRVNLANFAALVTNLENIFGDSSRRITAEEGVHSLMQRNRDFVTYLTEFERYRADVEWDDRALLHALKHGISKELDQALLSHSTDNLSLQEFITLATEVDNKLRTMMAKHALRYSSRPATTATRPAPPRSFTNPAPTPAPAASQSTATGTHAGPMDLSANSRRLSPAEKARRMKEGLCWYCGDANHIACNCPRKGTSPLRAHETQFTHVSQDDVSAPATESGNA